MANIAIIPARGGSKRVPGKNIREFCGKPIITYSIEAALKSGLFDEVMVSTDSEKIAGVAREAGANVPFMRSAQASNDFATTRDVLVEVLGEYEKRGRSFEYISCIYPCAVFVTPEKLRNAFELLKNAPEADGIEPIVQYSCPPQRSQIIRDGYLVYTYPEFTNSRTQDMEPIYHDCGQFYFWRVKPYLEKESGACKILPIIMPDEEVQDVDNESDLRIAAIKYRTFILGE